MFKAKSQGTDIEEAETVAETHDTEVEKPIDMEDAEVVEDEEKEELEGEPDKVCCESGSIKTLVLDWSGGKVVCIQM